MNRLNSLTAFTKAHPVGVLMLVAVVYFGCVGIGRATGASDGHPVLLGRTVAPVAIYIDRHGEAVVWQDGNGAVHGHLQERGWWITRFLFGSVYGEADTVSLTDEQIAKRLEAESKAVAVKAAKAAKVAAKSKK